MSLCPSLEELQCLLNGAAGSEAEALEAHVEACPACQQALEELTAGRLLAEQWTLSHAGPCADPESAGTDGRDFLLRLENHPPALAATLAGAAPEVQGDWPEVSGYEVLGELGRGGMGVVYLASQQGLNRLVALKMIGRDRAASPRALGRFRREAEAVARLQHPHVVAVLAWGEHDGMPYFALEYCPGGSLHGQVRGRPQPPVEAARLVEKLARAVQAAHEAGIVHRDLKPSNVLLAPAGDEPALNTLWGIPKVADFGLCRSFETDGQQTAEGAVMGSPPYMAPEQAEGRTRDVGPATDVWALGAILFELLAGRPPFSRTSQPAILHAICYEEPPRPSALQPGVPAELEAICLKCLRKPVGERYVRAADLAADLRAWLTGQSPDAVQEGIAGPSLPGPPPAPETLSWRERRLPRWGWLAAGLLLAGLLGLGGWAWLSRSPRPTAEPKPLSIRLQIFRRSADGDQGRPLGELGESTYRVRFDERVVVEAALSEPAYAYLIAFNPAPNDKPQDQEQPFPQSEADRPPEKRDRVAPPRTLRLNDGEGLEVFTVVASRQPLPAYTAWQKERPRLKWQQRPAPSGIVWRADGVSSVQEFYDPVHLMGPEGGEDTRTIIDELARQLKGMPGVEAVAVVGFAVDKLK
jgi:serine/threonine protein kinase